MKKIIITLFALIGIFTLIGCGQQNGQNETEEENNNSEVVYRALYSSDGRFSVDTIIFKTDGTFIYHSKAITESKVITSYEENGKDWHDLDSEGSAIGSYTGKPYESGDVCITFEKIKKNEGEFEDYLDDDDIQNLVISENKFVLLGNTFVRSNFLTSEVSYEYKNTEGTHTILFKKDGTLICHSKTSTIYDDLQWGYYTGNAIDNNTIIVLITKYKTSSGEITDYRDENALSTITITNGKLIFGECEFIRIN